MLELSDETINEYIEEINTKGNLHLLKNLVNGGYRLQDAEELLEALLIKIDETKEIKRRTHVGCILQ